MANVEMSLEEYEQLRSMAMSGECPSCAGGNPHPESVTKKGTRKKTSSDRKMSKALKEATAKGKKKSGAWKKGWNQSRVMKEAHRLKKGM